MSLLKLENATIRFEIADKKTRYFNGEVSRLTQVANKDGFACYRATIVPWLTVSGPLWKLGLDVLNVPLPILVSPALPVTTPVNVELVLTCHA